MRLSKANIAGLTSPQQQSEMKSILAGAWPPLKPLPVFKYEAVEYRARIDFDKKRGEWVCRKTSLPSNQVQELRGGLLGEVTMALPHGEVEMFTESAESQDHELEKDKNRRLQALQDWGENYENGALYFELRDYLSESQRTELDASLRLSLTARQLQFNSKNVASVFDDLSIAGGRFATLIDVAKRNKAKQQGTDLPLQGEGAVVDAEHAIGHDSQSAGVSSRESEGVLNNDNPFVRDRDPAGRCTDADELPAVSIKNVIPEQDQASLAERTGPTASQQFEIETSELADASSLAEYPCQEGPHSAASSGPASHFRTGQSSPDRIEGSSRIPAFEVSTFQVAAFAILFLFAVLAFTIGLTVGRSSFGRPLREASKSTLASQTKSSILPGQPDVSTSRTPTPPLPDSAGTDKLDDARGSEYFAEVRSPDSDSSRTTEPPEAIGPISTVPRSPVLISTIGAAPNLLKPSTILVTVPSRGQPFRVSSPMKAIAATSSFAMTSQLSFLVPPADGPAVADKPARLQAGELAYFVWPRYARPGTIRVRATIGQVGQVLEVKFLGGSVSLLPATMRAIRQWRYRPTLLDKRPVQAQQDVTIEFRPSQHSSQVSSQRSSHKHN